jgi:hypothetical protein
MAFFFLQNILFPVTLGHGTQDLCLLNKCSITELLPHPSNYAFVSKYTTMKNVFGVVQVSPEIHLDYYTIIIML